MSHSKKSRKVNPNGPTWGDRAKEPADTGRVRRKNAKRKGLKSGSRNAQEAHNASGKSSQANKDPRLGSKKPVALVPVAEVVLKDRKPMAKVVKSQPKPQLTPEKELEQLENSERLNELLEQVDEGKPLSQEDQSWVDKQMARHKVLMEELGLLEDDEEEPQPEGSTEEDLLQQFENVEYDPTQFKD